MRVFVLMFALSLSPLVCAQEAPEAADDPAQVFVDSLHFQDGEVALPSARATLKLPPSFRYLDAADAERVLTELWGNPPGSESLGMLVPTATSLADPDNSWAIVLQYDNDGYVSDEDAKEIDYQELLEDMQEGARDSNPERERQGYPAIEIVGWAESPRYDSGTHKMHWAKELSVDGAAEHTLNYDVRVLGRSGVLTMRAIAGISQLSAIKPGMGEALGAVDFNQGARYADFNPNTDRVAEYGLAALVAGGIAAKTGLLSKLLALLIAGKKLVIGGFVLLAAGVSKLFGKKTES
ncbi:MAG: DUF2167 domain-containing protein [Lysobacterales bacterium]